MKILYHYINGDGETVEEQVGELGNWSMIPALATCVQAVKRPKPKPRPKRDDEVAAWLKRQRDGWLNSPGEIGEYWALDMALDDYRLHADTGTPLSEDVETR